MVVLFFINPGGLHEGNVLEPTMWMGGSTVQACVYVRECVHVCV